MGASLSDNIWVSEYLRRVQASVIDAIYLVFSMPQNLFQVDGLVDQALWHGDFTLDQVFIGGYARGRRPVGRVSMGLLANVILD